VTATKETPSAVERVTNDGFDEFYRRHRHRLLALAYAVSGSRLGAEDLAHDALEAAYRDWDRIRDLDNPTAWVQRIVTNRAVSAYRRRLSELRTLTRLRSETHTVAFPDLRSETEWLWAKVRRLPRRQVQVVALTYVEGLSMPEIARVLGISKESVNTHLRRARGTLARLIEITDPEEAP
jgi:RNA polymerase sigma factor (sigma-70 family)